ncbi:hypothetical protein [Rubripirellula reticaptiva]|uniref:Uncharacterized protein n=1 Tax=Rubripirellula reticaptiva TaxID=2528013 RepID=A0A5C6ESX0_9BACT|nr:hypothetical protein [Rubripirellula reticaptiva]TWU51420.1 hypothetical protein Poly59_30120 [Rubripirellula reticaptiva]
MKLPIRERIPESFVAYLAEVDQLIRCSDPSAITPSDDLLQCDDAYGGRLDDGSLDFAFTFFPEPFDDLPFPPLWYFTLSEDQISKIAAGNLTDLDMWRCPADCGFRGSTPDYYCSRCN